MAELLGLFEPRSNEKPRERGITKTLTNTRINERFLDRYGQFVDIVKLLPQIFYVPESEIKSDIDLYHEHDIEVTYSSALVELAVATDRHDELVDKLEGLEIDWIEYPADSRLTTKEVAADVDELHDRGFQVFAEIGNKWWWKDHTRMAIDEVDVATTIAEFEKYLDAGVDMTDWEGYIPRNLIGRNLGNYDGQKDVIEVVNAVGLDNITLEILGPSLTSHETSIFWCWLIRQFGPDVNLGNVPVGSIPSVEAMRDGIRFEMDNPYIRWLDEGKPTAEWWQMPPPPHEIGLERDD